MKAGIRSGDGKWVLVVRAAGIAGQRCHAVTAGHDARPRRF